MRCRMGVGLISMLMNSTGIPCSHIEIADHNISHVLPSPGRPAQLTTSPSCIPPAISSSVGQPNLSPRSPAANAALTVDLPQQPSGLPVVVNERRHLVGVDADDPAAQLLQRGQRVLVLAGQQSVGAFAACRMPTST